MGANVQDGHEDTAPWQEHVADGRVEQQTSPKFQPQRGLILKRSKHDQRCCRS